MVCACVALKGEKGMGKGMQRAGIVGQRDEERQGAGCANADRPEHVSSCDRVCSDRGLAR